MNLNEDGTITLSMKETQKFVTKVINPEFKQLERMRKFHQNATTKDIANIIYRLRQVESKVAAIASHLKEKSEYVSTSSIRGLERELSYLSYTIECAGDDKTGVDGELEKAYNLYRMLLKNRRFKEDE